MQDKLEEEERKHSKTKTEDFSGVLTLPLGSYRSLLRQFKFKPDSNGDVSFLASHSSLFPLHVVAEALKSDMQLLENGLQEAGKGKMLVPKAIDADDEDNPSPSDDDSDGDEVLTGSTRLPHVLEEPCEFWVMLLARILGAQHAVVDLACRTTRQSC